MNIEIERELFITFFLPNNLLTHKVKFPNNIESDGLKILILLRIDKIVYCQFKSSSHWWSMLLF